MAAVNISDERDYEVWARDTKSKLMAKGLWDVVETGVPPDPSKIPELAATIQAEELSRWRDLAIKDMRALQVLQSALTDSSFRKSLSASSAKDVWDSIGKTRLEKQLEEISMHEAENLGLYIDRVKNIVEQLRRLNIVKSDYEVIKKVLNSLSGQYKSAGPILEEHMDPKKMTLESLTEFFDIYDLVVDEPLHLMLKECYSIPIPTPRSRKCFQCGEGEHNAKNCKRENLRKKIKERLQVATEALEEEEEIEVEYLMLTEEAFGKFNFDDDMWMIYAKSTTNHMTPHEKYFTTLDKTHKAKVGLVDGKFMKVEGRGDVKIMMKEGKTKTIKNVLFVPELSRNVLSLDQMIARGWSVETKPDRCIFLDRTGAEFGDTVWDERGPALRLHVIKGNLNS